MAYARGAQVSGYAAAITIVPADDGKILTPTDKNLAITLPKASKLRVGFTVTIALLASAALGGGGEAGIVITPDSGDVFVVSGVAKSAGQTLAFTGSNDALGGRIKLVVTDATAGAGVWWGEVVGTWS